MTQPILFIGIDPGASGGVATVCGQDACAWPMPDTGAELIELLQRFSGSVAVAFTEKVGPTPQMGVVSSFKFGRSVERIEVACAAVRLRLELVTPQKWQKELGLIVKGRGLGQDDTSKKNRNKARAAELFPQLKITHAVADALLIAEYGRRQWRESNHGREQRTPRHSGAVEPGEGHGAGELGANRL